MKRLVLFSALLVVVASAQAASAGQTVSIASYSFTPPSVTAAFGDELTFNNTATIAHTSTSDGGFWDTGRISGGSSATVGFSASGTFPYHCAIHPSMKGVIIVPITIQPAGPVTAGKKLTITFASNEVSGRTFDVQRRRGNGRWVTIASATSALFVTNTPRKAGKFRFRAAALMDGQMSGWSPPLLVKVTAP